MALSLTIGYFDGLAIDYTPYVDFRTITINDSVQVSSDSMEFTLIIYDYETAPPLAGMEVIFKDGSTKEFAGVLVKATRYPAPEYKGIIFDCECKDYVYLLNRRMVNETYATQAAGQTIKDILTDLYDNSDSDTHYEYFKDNVGNIQDGPTLQGQTWDNIQPSQVFDSIAQATGMQWWIDFDKKVYFKELNTSLATHLPTDPEFPGYVLKIDTDIDNYGDYQETESIEDIGTHLILRGIREISTASHVDEWVGSDGHDHNGNSRKIFYLSRRPFSLAHVTSVTKGTGGGDVEQDLKAEDIDGSPPGGEGDSNDVYRRVRDENSYIRFSDSNAVGATDVIKCTYKYIIENDTESVNASGVSEMARRTGGDGYHQFVYAQTSGLSIRDQDRLAEIEDLLLLRKSTVLRTASFTSWTKGWSAGQLFLRRWESQGLDGIMYVLNVVKRVLTPADDPNLSDNVILAGIECANVPYGVSI